jgi:hypothetical protein
MSVSDYDLLKQKLDEIISTSERFPESVRELVYRSQIEALLRDGKFDPLAPADGQQAAGEKEQPIIEPSPIIGPESQDEFLEYLKKYKDIRLNDMQFCAVVAKFFTRETSGERRLDAIDPELLMAAVRIAGRPKHPANPATTLNNARNVGKYLEPRGKGVYGISDDGVNKLERDLEERSR